MKIILVRHGETLEGQKNILMGHLPGTLSLSGIAYAKRLGRWLADHIPPDKIISSDLGRAKDTTRYILSTFHKQIPVLYTPLIRERDVGIMQGLKNSVIDWEKYEQKKFPYRKHIGGESFLDVKKRAQCFLSDLTQEKISCVLVVTHSVFIAMVIASYYHLPIKQSLEQNYYQHIVVLDIDKNKLECYDIEGAEH